MKNSENQKEEKMKRTVIKDCFFAMRTPVVLKAIAEGIVGVLGVMTADVVGEFADAAFNLDLTLGIRRIFVLVACILATVFIAPAIGLWGDFSMLKHALRHDNFVFGRYLDKKPDRARVFDSEEMQYQLEDAPNSLRIQWVVISSITLSLPISIGFFLYFSGNISWLMTGLMFVLALIKLISPIIFKDKLAGYDRLEREYRTKRRAFESDITTNPSLIKLWGLQNSFLNRVRKLYTDYYREVESKYINLKVYSGQSGDFLNRFSNLSILILGSVMVATGNISPGNLASLMIYFEVLQSILHNMGIIIQRIPLFKNAVDIVCKIYADSESVAGEAIDHFIELEGENICCSFSDKEVIQCLNFFIAKGDKVGVLGENGSGKSTLCRIICATIREYDGTMLLNGINLKEIRVDMWRNLIAYAPQTPYLFHATVRENLILGDCRVAKKDVDKLMSDFNILYLADRVVSMNTGLSGGEKQKISIIRALLKKSELLILDEPSNHLDEDSIMILKEKIENTNQTVILVTHDEAMCDIVTKLIYL